MSAWELMTSFEIIGFDFEIFEGVSLYKGLSRVRFRSSSRLCNLSADSKFWLTNSEMGLDGFVSWISDIRFRPTLRIILKVRVLDFLNGF